VKQESCLSGTAGAPGEQLFLTATAYNETSGPADFVVLLKRRVRLWAEGRTAFYENVVEAFRQAIEPGGKLVLSDAPVTVPQLSPSYHGGLLINQSWEEKLRSYGASYPNIWWTGRKTDPVVWWYQVEIGVDIIGSRFNLTRKFPFTMTTVPAVVVSVPAVVVSPSPETMLSVGDMECAPPTYLPVQVAETVPITVVTGEVISASWVPAHPPVNTTGVRDDPFYACSSLEYQRHYFTVPATAVTVVDPVTDPATVPATAVTVTVVDPVPVVISQPLQWEYSQTHNVWEIEV